jgi:hypothetical protein
MSALHRLIASRVAVAFFGSPYQLKQATTSGGGNLTVHLGYRPRSWQKKLQKNHELLDRKKDRGKLNMLK